MKKLAIWFASLSLLGLCAADFARAETKYALCVGINEYSEPGNDLSGCVNDADYFYNNLITRGGCQSANMTKLTDSAATTKAIRNAITSYASKAKAGDTFIYQHSSHGGWNYPDYSDDEYSTFLCSYEYYYEDTELAADLAKFASGVKVVVIVDACHSGGLFKDASSTPTVFDLATRVTGIMDANRAERLARGVKGVEKSISSSEIGWVTAAEYNQSSLDGGYYDTSAWMNSRTSGSIEGGVFLGAFTWAWWNGTCDTKSGYGDNDGYADAYECWKIAYDCCTKSSRWGSSAFTPQHTNDTVLRSVELGWVGDTAPVIGPGTPEIPSTPPVAGTSAFTATWSAVADAVSYKLYVQQKVAASTAARAARDAATVLEADFSDTTGWTLSGTSTYTSSGYAGAAVPSIKFDSTGDYAISPEFSGGTTLSFWALGNNGSGSTFAISGLVNGSWTEIETVSIDQGGKTYEVALPSGTTQVRFDFTKSVNCALDDVVVTGSADTWEDIPGSPFTVSGTSKALTGLSSGTEYRYAVSAVDSNGDEGALSSYVTVTTAEGDTAPAWDAIPAQSYIFGSNEGYFDFNVSSYASGSPSPAFYLAAPPLSATLLDTGEFTFEPAALGTFDFTVIASNSLGTASTTLTVTVSAAPVAVPTLLVDATSATTAYATWDECTGVTTYTLQLASDDQFTTGGSGAAVLEADFSDTTGWTLSGTTTYTSSGYAGAAVPSIKFDGTGDYAISPEFSGGTSLSFWALGNNGSGSTFAISGLVNGTWTEIETVSIDQGGKTYEVALPSGTTQIRFDFTKSVNCALDDVVVTGASGSGSLIAEYTVADTEYEFTGLTPNTTYYVRVKGNDAWSDVEDFTTEAGAETAPSIDAIADRTMSIETIELDFTVTASGNPAPTFSVASSDAPAGSFTIGENTGAFSFMPDGVGTFHFTVTAANGISPDATASFAVTVTGTAPTLAAIADRTITLEDGGVEFTVTATGAPAPTFSVTSSDAPAGDYGIGETTGEFSFLAYSAGTYHFTITAANGVSPDATQSFAITVVDGSAVTVPTLLVGDVGTTTAYATWDECTGVTSYTLQLASDNQFTTGGSGGGESVELVNEGFDNGTTLPTGWTEESGSISGTYTSSGNFGASSPSLQFKSSVTLSTPTLSNPTNVSFWYKGQGSGITSTLVVQQLVGGDWSEVGSAEITTSAATFSHALNPSATQVRFVFTKATGNLSFDDVVITGTSGSGSSGSGSLIAEYTVADTEYEFTGLTPNTTYYVRVKGNDAWSNVESFTTEAGAGAAPSIDAIADRTMSIETIELDFTVTASGNPAPTFSVASSDAPAGSFTIGENTGAFSFMPDGVGTFHFTVTAANGISPDATATFAVTVTGTAPTLAAIADRTITLADGGDEFTVTATGAPAPTFSVTSSDAPAGDYGIGETTGVFSFLAYSAGTYHFTITAANGVSPDATQSFAITVTDGSGPLESYVEWLERSNLDSSIPASTVASDGKTYEWHYITDTIPGSGEELGIVISNPASGTFTVSAVSEFRYYQLVYTTDLSVPFESYTTVNLGWGEDIGTVSFPVEGDWYGGICVLLEEP